MPPRQAQMGTAGALVQHFMDDTISGIYPLDPVRPFFGEIMFHFVTCPLQHADLCLGCVFRT